MSRVQVSHAAPIIMKFKWMPPSADITRKHLLELNHEELHDAVLVDFTARELDTSIYLVIKNALNNHSGEIYETHLNNIFSRFLSVGRIPPHVRQYCINVLIGKDIFILDIDEEQKDAILVA